MKIFILFGPEEQGLRVWPPPWASNSGLPNQVRQPQVGPRRTGVERGLNHLRFLSPPKGLVSQALWGRLEPVWKPGVLLQGTGQLPECGLRVPPTPPPAVCSVYTSALARILWWALFIGVAISQGSAAPSLEAVSRKPSAPVQPPCDCRCGQRGRPWEVLWRVKHPSNEGWRPLWSQGLKHGQNLQN